MSVLRRLYNVAYGKVRAWQRTDGPGLDPELRGEPGTTAQDLRAALRERWLPAEPAARDEADEPAGDEEPDGPRPEAAPRERRL